MDITTNIEKPKDWPGNQREARIENIKKAMNQFKENPTYLNKEVLMSLIIPNDINEFQSEGIARVTDYEVALINTMFFDATSMSLFIIKAYFYYHIYQTILSYRMIPIMLFSDEDIFESFNGLAPQLMLFYVSYFNYRNVKNRLFADQLVHEMNLFNSEIEENNNDFGVLLLNLMHDLSFWPAVKVFPIIQFTRDELIKLFSAMASCLYKSNKKITERPERGILSIIISNWILRSRNDYNTSNKTLYKYISDSASKKILTNNEIWMQKTEYLNDKREGKLIKELYSNKQWINYEWAKNIVLNNSVITFVSSFSKSKPTLELEKEYGSNYFGYKNDRIYAILSPISKSGLGNINIWAESVNYYDVIYGLEEAKSELIFLFKVIDLFNANYEEKNAFLNHIIGYWIFSFKDKKWSNEEERRYEIRIYDDYDNYYDLNIDSKFLKMKSTIFLYPDFVSQNNIIKEQIKKNRLEKITTLSTRKIVFCNDCLYDEVYFDFQNKDECIMCKSKNITIL